MILVLCVAAITTFGILIILAFSPVPKSPTSRVTVKINKLGTLTGIYEKHDLLIGVGYILFFLIILALALVQASSQLYAIFLALNNSQFYNDPPFIFFGFVFIGLFLCLLIVLYRNTHRLVNQILRCMTGCKSQYSVRPLCCARHDRKVALKKLNSTTFMNDAEEVSARLSQIGFEVWHCPECYEQPDLKSVHLRAYQFPGRDSICQSQRCPRCMQSTMTKTVTIRNHRNYQLNRKERCIEYEHLTVCFCQNCSFSETERPLIRSIYNEDEYSVD